VVFPKLSIVLILALVLAAGVLWAVGNNAGTASTVPSTGASMVSSDVLSTVQRTTTAGLPPPPGQRYGRRTPQVPTGPRVLRPNFTGQDVINLVNRTRGDGLIDGVDPNTPPTIISVRFLTEREYRAIYRANNGQPDDTLLCVVELAGRFTVVGPPQAGNETCGRASIILNVQTGSQLGYSIDCGQ
jgi:hypothetical protein